MVYSQTHLVPIAGGGISVIGKQLFVKWLPDSKQFHCLGACARLLAEYLAPAHGDANIRQGGKTTANIKLILYSGNGTRSHKKKQRERSHKER
jgi:hypothetical protein